jgi:xylan 1,4-beta-xylosidase
VDDFLKHTSTNQVPVDFVASHGYADDTVENLFHTNENIPVDRRVCRAIAKVRGQIRSSATPTLPLMWTEWNVPSFGEQYHARDTIYVGAALADTVRQCDGLVDMMSFWTFSDVFEENGPVKTPFYGGFGLVAAGGIRKPSFNAYALLHKLGAQRIASDSPEILVTRRDNGRLAIALWNLVDPDQRGHSRHVRIQFRNLPPGGHALLTRLDATHGNVLPAYEKMGQPRYPTLSQIQNLNRASELSAPESITLRESSLDLTLSPNALFLLELSR